MGINTNYSSLEYADPENTFIHRKLPRSDDDGNAMSLNGDLGLRIVRNQLQEEAQNEIHPSHFSF